MIRFAAPLVLAATVALAMVSGRPMPYPPPIRSGPDRPTPAEQVRAGYVAGVDSLTEAIGALATSRNPAAFRRARRTYKRIEYLVAELMPEAERTLNGPSLPRPHETVVDATIPPTGLQVLEAALLEPSRESDSIVARQLRLLAPTLEAVRRVRVDASTADARIFDAARQEIARITTLGLAGFDAAISRDGVLESAEALRGVRQGMSAYQQDEAGPVSDGWRRLDAKLASAIAVLEARPDFDRFDRLAFITDHAAPLATALTAFQAALGVPRTARPTAWYARTNTIFDAGALDRFDYAPSDAALLRPDVLALGKQLFFDARLSAGNRRSCATCHQPAHAFTDGRRLPQVDEGHGVVRNVPTLLNAALQPFQLADQRAHALEDQIAVVLANPREMNLPLEAAVAKLQGDRALAGEFSAVYGVPSANAVTPRRLQTTLAAFVRSLVATSSRFDRAVAGDTRALTREERRGFNLFMGKAACGTCHFAPTFGGSLPPELLESEPEVIGVPARTVSAGASIDPDSGVAGFDHVPIHLHAFKTPSLRNVALTAPYMHNGVFATLDEVVDFYDRGGGAGIGIELPNQTLSPEPLHLSRSDKRALVAFMRALTDTTTR